MSPSVTELLDRMHRGEMSKDQFMSQLTELSRGPGVDIGYDDTENGLRYEELWDAQLPDPVSAWGDPVDEGPYYDDDRVDQAAPPLLTTGQANGLVQRTRGSGSGNGGTPVSASESGISWARPRGGSQSHGDAMPGSEDDFDRLYADLFSDPGDDRLDADALDHPGQEQVPAEKSAAGPRPRRGDYHIERSTAGQRANADFVYRNEVFNMRKARHQYQLQQQKEVAEMKECRFRPDLSKGSRKHQPARVSSDNLVQRLSHNPSRVYVAESLKREKDEEEQQQCTFKPDTRASKRSLASSNRAFQRSIQSLGILPDDLLELADLSLEEVFRIVGPGAQVFEEEQKFHPRTNQVPEHMVSAQAYLRENVFDRLSKPPPDEEQSRFDVPEASESSVCSSISGMNRPRLHDFLQRQNERDEMRQEKMRQLQQSQAPKCAPSLCDRSLAMVSRGGHGTSFYERLDADMQKREGARVGREQQLMEDRPQVPAINPKSRTLPSRTASQMYDDARRKAERVDELRKKHEERNNSETTFCPTTNRNSNAVSKIRIDGDYTMRLKAAQAKREEAARRAREEREQAEKAECTHRPKTTEAPKFVKQIAESRKALSRQAKENQPVKPDWK